MPNLKKTAAMDKEIAPHVGGCNDKICLEHQRLRWICEQMQHGGANTLHAGGPLEDELPA